MAELTIDLPQWLGEWIVEHAREHGRSVEDEVVAILQARHETAMTLARVHERRERMNVLLTDEILERSIAEGRLESLEDLEG